MSDGSEDDFAALFEASLKSKRIEQGQTVEGAIVAIGPDVAFVDVGGKGEATIDVAELKDEDGDIEVAVGERIQAVVASTSGGLILSRRLARGAASARQLEDAYRAGLPVQGKVEREVKGGYEIRVGHARGFCPFSQIDIVRLEGPAHVGRVYEFRIIEFRDGGRNLVLSRRALLEEARKAEAEEVRRAIAPGAIVTGRVASVRDFGAFIDLGGGVQGLLHVSEMGWSRVDDPSNLLSPGEPITVKVLAVDDARQKISLGLKQLSDDPWSRVQGAYEIGQVRTGRVTRVADFGAFVELEPGIEALAHASTFPASGRRETWSTMVAPGTTALFEIVSIDVPRKRIGVAPVPEGSARARAHEAAAAGEEPAETSEKAPESGQGFGSLADKLRGALGPKES